MILRGLIARLFRDTGGMMAVETAIVATVVALLSLGSFQISSYVARQNELQGAAANALAIALAAKPDTTTKLDTIKSIIRTSTGLGTDQVTISYVYRCGTQSTVTATRPNCNEDKLWTYVRIVLTDTYRPMWTSFGVGGNVSIRVDRTVQIS